jgi:hypothetical protein
MSVVTKAEGPRIENAEGRSEGPVVAAGFAKVALEGASVAAKRAPEACGGAQDLAGSLAHLGIGGGVDVEVWMFETESPLEREQCGVGEVDNEGFGCDEQSMRKRSVKGVWQERRLGDLLARAEVRDASEPRAVGRDRRGVRGERNVARGVLRAATTQRRLVSRLALSLAQRLATGQGRA